AGVEEDVRFIKEHPVVSIEGCAAQCQRKIVELSGGHVDAVIIVEEIAKKNKISIDKKKSEIDKKLAYLVGEEASKVVDRIYDGLKEDLPSYGNPRCQVSIQGDVCVVPCTGMGKALGGAARLGGFKAEERGCLATYVCLPSLAAKSDGYEDAIKKMPSITIDGCVEKCASKIVQASGGKVKNRIFVPKLMKDKGLKPPENRIELGEEGESVAKGIADEIEKLVSKMKVEQSK
ncbi:MAG: putative zinc-binding protein, partial [Thermoplasmata archaeon]